MAPADAAGQFVMSFAGDTLNTAWYAKQLRPDWQIDYLTAVGNDDISRHMVSFLKDAGVGTSHLQRRDDRTLGLYMISLRGGERHFSYWRGQAAARRMADDGAALRRAFADAEVLYFSGITLAILEGDGRDRLLDSLARARASGKTVVFDSNLRPALWGDVSQMCDWVAKAAMVSDVVLPSYDDEAQFFGDRDVIATRDRYAAHGASTVVVKNGPGLIHYQHGKERGVVEPAIVSDVVDTTAAGDSFNAGFLVEFCAGAPMESAVTVASDVARRVIRGRGALVSI